MREREHLAQVDQYIAECKARIARQRDVIANAFERGEATGIAVSMLRALETSLRTFEQHRHVILSRWPDQGRERGQ
jgi:hypothetical protein